MNKMILAGVAGLALSMCAAVQAADGKAIYEQTCKACHANGVAGAPKPGDKAAWAPRIAQGDATLLEHATKGLNAMPPKGTCAACTEDDLKAAIAYMTSQSK